MCAFQGPTFWSTAPYLELEIILQGVRRVWGPIASPLRWIASWRYIPLWRSQCEYRLFSPEFTRHRFVDNAPELFVSFFGYDFPPSLDLRLRRHFRAFLPDLPVQQLFLFPRCRALSPLVLPPSCPVGVSIFSCDLLHPPWYGSMCHFFFGMAASQVLNMISSCRAHRFHSSRGSTLPCVRTLDICNSD